ncbi:MAG: hypothetical protein GWO41_00885 [candidate division Zixibacteria bacterium]|nr:hypothetical protein [candidate division Zixibacteria bacterium]NIR65464.1 hypothetical protein [candidate division Zixibacteria bacterium]NIS14789.1 hypothetical protein [candidate division Zixibacteria bacterium]NIS45736.1 hypothetical protein [candidate division Zixibacteria bacterium]NIT51337.1 hypothetical protein [candidate division Zixibacteria bacterium]
MKNILIPILIFLTAISAIAIAQEEKKDYRYYQRKAIEAYQNQDLDGFVANTELALKENPQSSAMMYNLACGYSLLGETDTALAVLKRLALMGIDYGVEDDPDLEAVRKSSGFKKIKSIYEETLRPVNSSRILYEFSKIDILPEGMAYDPRTGRSYIGSMRFGRIYLEDNNGNLLEFATLDNEIPLACLGLKVDTSRSILWAVGSSFDLIQGFKEEDQGTTGLFGFDLESAKMVKRIIYPEKFPPFGFNDLTVSSTGDVYLSGISAHVYRHNTGKLDTLISGEKMAGSNGIALSTDETMLFVADYAGGIIVVDLSSGESVELKCPPDISLYGIDGMYFHEGSLIAIQNAFNPWRVARFYLNDDYTAVESMTVLEQKNPAAVEAFTGSLAGDKFNYIALGKAPEEIPEYVPAQVREYIGRTLILQTPLK